MKILGLVTKIIGVLALLSAVLQPALGGSAGIAWTPLLVGLLAIIVGQNCVVIARVQGRLQTMEGKWFEFGNAARVQQSAQASQQMTNELQQQGLLRETGTTADDDLDAALE